MTLIIGGSLAAEAIDGQMRTLKRGDPVFPTDTICTSERGYAKLALHSGQEIYLKPRSRTSMDHFI